MTRPTFVLLSITALGLGLLLQGCASYRTETANQALIGLNSTLASPVDPFAEVISPPEAFEDAPLAPVTGRFLGLGAGLLLMVHRAVMGVVDFVFSPFPMMPVSPAMRFSFVPDLVHEREEDPEWLCDLDGWGEEARSGGHRVGVLFCGPLGMKGSAYAGEDE